MNSSFKHSSEIQGFDPGELFKHGFTYGSIDLIQGGSFQEVIGRTIIYLLTARKKHKEGFIFSGATIILPPVGTSKITEESIDGALSTGLEALRGTAPDKIERAILKKKVRVIHCETLESGSLKELVVRESDGRLVVVADGSKYRDASVSSPLTVGLSAVRMAEDRWVPHVASLCQHCVAAVRQTESYALIHVDETPPQNPELEAILVAIEDCYIASIRTQDDPEEL